MHVLFFLHSVGMKVEAMAFANFSLCFALLYEKLKATFCYRSERDGDEISTTSVAARFTGW